MSDSDVKRLEAEVADYRSKFERIEKLCHESIDTLYTIKIVQKMVEETLRLARQKDNA